VKKILLLISLVAVTLSLHAQKKSIQIQKTVVKTNPCSEIHKFTDKGIILYSTDFRKQIQVVRSVSSIDTAYYLFLQTTGNILVEEPLGYFILLNSNSNGKIVKEDYKVKVEKNDKHLFNGDKYIYSASTKITYLNFIEIAMHGIIGFKIDIFEGYFSEEDNELLKQQTHCLWR